MTPTRHANADEQRFLYFWDKWWQHADGDTAIGPKLGKEIFSLYQSVSRVHHDYTHPLSMWELLEVNQSLAVNPTEIGLAIPGHDVIYDPLAKDNEERSAEYFGAKLSKGGVEDETVGRVARLILVTKDHRPTTADEELMVDLDLAILGQKPSRYRAYAQSIRQEYGMYSDAEFRAGRAKFISFMLERTSIYHTDAFRSNFEQQARENLERELHQLQMQ